MSETSLPGQLPAAVAPSDGRPSTPAGPAGNPELLRFNSNSGDEGDQGRDAPTGASSSPNGALSTSVRHVHSTGGRGSRSLPLTPMATLTVNRTSTMSGGGEKRPRNSKLRILEAADKDVALAQIEQFKDSRAQRYRVILRLIVGRIQKYSVPLVLGVTIALVWNNIDEESYHNFIDGAIIEGASILDSDLHGLSLHFIVNDFFMCFFFGLAIKEVTEALLPGGCLHPLKKAVNPLLATLGGVLGPVATYAIMVAILYAAGSFDGQLCVSAAGADGHRRLGGGGEVQTGPSEPCTLGGLLKGWGVPTATDISLAWMFAVIIFGAGHPAINFLLLLAIVDDALGMVIIAVFYPDPNNPVQPLWLGLVLASMVIAYGMRKFKVPSWPVFVAVCGPFSWLGLFKSHVHPALALVFIVPFMPACHAIEADIDGTSRDLGACDLGPKELEVFWPSQGSSTAMEQVPTQNSHKTQHTQASNPVPKEEHMPPSPAMKKMKSAINLIAGISEEEAPLHQFEHQLKLPVDLGMFFFGLANAGVRLGSVGGITASVGVSLLVGKTLGIALFSLLGVGLGFGLPDGVTVGNLFSMSAIAGVGLTVALFVANEAFIDPELRGQAKMGAVLSVACGGVGWLLERLLRKDEFLEFN